MMFWVHIYFSTALEVAASLGSVCAAFSQNYYVASKTHKDLQWLAPVQYKEKIVSYVKVLKSTQTQQKKVKDKH